MDEDHSKKVIESLDKLNRKLEQLGEKLDSIESQLKIANEEKIEERQKDAIRILDDISKRYKNYEHK